MQIQCAATLYGPKAQFSAFLVLNLQLCRGQGMESLEGRRKAEGRWTVSIHHSCRQSMINTDVIINSCSDYEGD